MLKPLAQCLLLVLCAAVLPACKHDAPTPQSPPHTQSLGDSGPLRATLTLSPTSLTTAQRITVRLEARLAPGLELAEIDLADLLPENLVLVDQRTDRRAADAGAAIITREWTLDPFLPGECEFPSITIACAAPPAGVSAEGGGEGSGSGSSASSTSPSPLATQPIKLTITTVLQPGEEDLADAKPVVDPPPETPTWVWWVFGLAAAVFVAIVLALRARARRLARPPPPVFVPAHDLALERLAALMERRLVESGRFEEFYSEASLILRRYIEDRFGLHAPERTTEEFLAECRASPVLMQDDIALLKKFLSHCDLVKFAAVIPSTPEAEGVAATVREFVDRTRDASRLVEIPAGARAA